MSVEIPANIKKWLLYIALFLGALSTALMSLSSCSSSKGLSLQADSIKTLNVVYHDSTSLQNPFNR